MPVRLTKAQRRLLEYLEEHSLTDMGISICGFREKTAEKLMTLGLVGFRPYSTTPHWYITSIGREEINRRRYA